MTTRDFLPLAAAAALRSRDKRCFGGEISQFYNNARRCTSRAALMTGHHPHKVVICNMTANDFPGYSALVSEKAPLPAVLNQVARAFSQLL